MVFYVTNLAKNMAKKDVDFLFEVGSLRRIPRAWQQILYGKVQNISEHSYRAALIAWIIALAEGADVSKVIKICLIHDIAESRTTDIAFLHREYVTRYEDLAEKHVFQGTILEKEAKLLLEEYNQRKTLEAKIVKDADNLDVDLELQELAYGGDTGAMSMQVDRKSVIRNKKLYTKTAKKMWDDIKKANPNEWHHTLTDNWVNNKKSAK